MAENSEHGSVQVPLPVWRRFLFDHADGGVLTGEVVRVVPFGAFVSLENGVHGLLHDCEYATPPEIGSTISVRIRQIDLARQRMSLAPA